MSSPQGTTSNHQEMKRVAGPGASLHWYFESLSAFGPSFVYRWALEFIYFLLDEWKHSQSNQVRERETRRGTHKGPWENRSGLRNCQHSLFSLYEVLGHCLSAAAGGMDGG